MAFPPIRTESSGIGAERSGGIDPDALLLAGATLKVKTEPNAPREHCIRFNSLVEIVQLGGWNAIGLEGEPDGQKLADPCGG
jgi:hypothetical protein